MTVTREKLFDFHTKFCADALELMRRKNRDYAGEKEGEQDPFGNLRRSEALGICTTEQGMLVRMSDKLARMATFASSGSLVVADEGVRDSCIDLANYAVLFAAWVNRKTFLAAGSKAEPELKREDFDKLPPGAARLMLGNGIPTEMIFSASVSQWLFMLGQRGCAAADAEIRCLYAGYDDTAGTVLAELRRSRYANAFAHLTAAPSPDGVGMVAEGSVP